MADMADMAVRLTAEPYFQTTRYSFGLNYLNIFFDQAAITKAADMAADTITTVEDTTTTAVATEASIITITTDTLYEFIN